MSNFLFVVHDARHDSRIDAWLRQHAAPADVHVERMGKRRLVVVSKEVAHSIRGSEFFRGSLVSTVHGCMVFGVDGWRDAPEEVRTDPGSHAGEYIAASWSDGRLTIDRDVFGQPRLAHTRVRGLIAASDSFLVLASLRRALGARITLNQEVLAARAVRDLVTSQQCSTETLSNEILYVPGSRGLGQTRHRLRFELTGPLMTDRVRTDRDPAELLRTSASNVGRIVQTLAGVEGWSTTLSLSGGLDSRVVLAGAVATDVVNDVLLYTRPAGNDVDREIALELMAAVGSGLKPAGGTMAPATEGPLTLWAASLLGFYDGFGPRNGSRGRTRDFGLTGIGAEIHKGNWDWRTIPALAQAVAAAGPARDAVEAQLLKGAASVGASAKDTNASELVYLGYRNAIHAGAGHIGVHMTGLHPVMQLDLARAAHQRLEGSFSGSEQGIVDMTLLLAPALVSERYDRAERILSPEEAQTRLRALGGPLEPMSALTVYGRAEDVVAGPSSLSLSIARGLGFEGPLSAASVLPMFDSTLDHVDDAALRAALHQLKGHARWMVEHRGGDLVTSEQSASRVLMLHALSVID
ncbi:hypothetical protein [Agrococcus sp. ARC_14]|uniref:hypothetical protein n=1 Tax=Agrococcus sp. ARC_14 TaxID=2919927 RepID=UPI001F06ADF8|nr:hypothetical protein [Agrococcus sp. ARC_14]MCH1883891.1 hypothetical protein [Agrococcus sp. ARC_14]